MDNYRHNRVSDIMPRIYRFAFMAAVGLFGAAGGVVSIGTQSALNISRILALAGYIVFAVVLATLIAMALFFWGKRSTLHASSRKVWPNLLFYFPPYSRSRRSS